MTKPFPSRATTWRLRSTQLQFGQLPILMGIVNVTPDSFSDGGKFVDPIKAVDHALQLEAEGADILDVGGESTRPDSEPVTPEEERRRVVPVIEAVSRQSGLPISIDTSKSEVARAALDAGAQIINDVTGLEGDPAMIDLARTSKAGICAMHMQGTPRTMQDSPTYKDVVQDIFGYLRDRRDSLMASGIATDRICLDPGIGFGKTYRHNLDLLAKCCRFHELGCPLLVGHSRKGFIAKRLGDYTLDRTAGTIGVSIALALSGVQILRVHDVRPVREALVLFQASGGMDSTG